MNARSILDADMSTLLGWARTGMDWWLAELSEMVPDRLRRMLVSPKPALLWDGKDALLPAETGSIAKPHLARAEVRLPAELCLFRELALPPMARRDLDGLVELEAERLMPLPADRMLVAAAQARGSGDVRPVAVVGVSRERIASLAALLREKGIVPVALVAQGPSAAVDLLPAARKAGLVAADPPLRLVWWSVAGLLLALNLATLVWRDADQVERLQAVVDSRRPIALGARRAVQRLERRTVVVEQAIARRRESDPLVPLAIVSKALPADAWIQRFAWDGQTLRIAGYRRGSGDLVKLLRDTGLFDEVRNTGSEVEAPIPVGQPFDITARARRS